MMGQGPYFRFLYSLLLPPFSCPFYGFLGLLCAFVGYHTLRFMGMRNRQTLAIAKWLKPALGGLMLGVVASSCRKSLEVVIMDPVGYRWTTCHRSYGRPGRQNHLHLLHYVPGEVGACSRHPLFVPCWVVSTEVHARNFSAHCDRTYRVCSGWNGRLFAGVAKTPIAALIMVAEMTGGYSLILPMMIVSSLAYLLLGKTSLYEKQVPTRVDSPAHIGDFAVDIMDHLLIKDAVTPGKKETISEGMRFEDILRFVVGSNQQDFPVIDSHGNLTGILRSQT